MITLSIKFNFSLEPFWTVDRRMRVAAYLKPLRVVDFRVCASLRAAHRSLLGVLRPIARGITPWTVY